MQVKYSVGYAYPELVNHAFQLRQQVFTHEQGFPADIDVDEYDDNALHVVLYIDHTPVAVLRCILSPIRPSKWVESLFSSNIEVKALVVSS